MPPNIEYIRTKLTEFPGSLHRPNKINRLCIFAHYDIDGYVDNYVIKYLKELKAVASKIIFVTVVNIIDSELNKIKGLVDRIIVRKNEGYDFMSWQSALRDEGYENLTEYDEIVIANDSCYGPFFPFSNMFDVMDMKRCDFWGITENYDYKYHIQSYFMVFRRSLVSSNLFRDFWESVKIEGVKTDIVLNYEVGMTSLFRINGFTCASYITYPFWKLAFLSLLAKFITVYIYLRKRFSLFHPKSTKSSGSQGPHKKRRRNKYYREMAWLFINPLNVNLSLFDGWGLIKRGCPLLKVQVLRENAFHDSKVNTWRTYLANYTKYDLHLLENHLSRVANKHC